jgi:GcrA cell cycle regulator
MRALPWTDERIGLLKNMWSGGLSCSQIAAELGGLTRNAVISKVHRIGLERREARVNPLQQQAARQRARQTRRPPQPPPIRILKLPANEPLPETIVDVDTPLAQRCTLFQLTPKSCRWPVGDPRSPTFYFCGGVKTAGSSYCAEHERRAHA